jgi:hypothetical protein
MSEEKILAIATAIKGHLVSLAANDRLPSDLTQLDEMEIANIIDGFTPTSREKAIEMASHYLCEFEDEEDDDNFVSIETQLIRISQHEKKDDFLDDVDGVMVWEAVQYQFTVEDFIDYVGWVD